jgi:aryl-alcohol dehydrogenase-like predicted oxidoreductase
MVSEAVQTRQLGNSDMQLTPVGFGAWAIGGSGWQFAWGAQDDQESIEAIHRALDLGINWIDTAAAYGLGHSEEVVAKALEGRTNRPYVFTKCSLVWGEDRQIQHNLKADSVRRECEASLRRLRVETIDLYQIHWPNPDSEIEEGWQTLAKLKEEGKIRYIGVSNFSVQQMERAQKIAPITSLQPPYSAIQRGVEPEILPFCQQHNIGVIAYSPMQSGLLTGGMTQERVANFPQDDWRKHDDDFREPRLSRNLALANLFTQIGARHGRSAGEVAVAWTLRLPAVTAAIVGFRNPKQVDGLIGAQSFRLEQGEIDEIETWMRANP